MLLVAGSALLLLLAFLAIVVSSLSWCLWWLWWLPLPLKDIARTHSFSRRLARARARAGVDGNGNGMVLKWCINITDDSQIVCSSPPTRSTPTHSAIGAFHAEPAISFTLSTLARISTQAHTHKQSTLINQQSKSSTINWLYRPTVMLKFKHSLHINKHSIAQWRPIGPVNRLP